MLDILFGRRVHSESEVLTYGDIVYTTDICYHPNTIEAWKTCLEKKLSFLGVRLAWQYTEYGRVEVRTLDDPDYVIEEITLHNMSLAAFAIGIHGEGPR